MDVNLLAAELRLPVAPEGEEVGRRMAERNAPATKDFDIHLCFWKINP